MQQLLSAKTSAWVAYCQTRGAKPKAPPAAIPLNGEPDHSDTAEARSATAMLPKTAEERLSRQARAPLRACTELSAGAGCRAGVEPVSCWRRYAN